MAADTEQALANSLKKLLGKKTLDKITVRDITDDCGVNRQTFYYHFQDVYDLVEWIFTEAAKQYRDRIDLSNWRDVVLQIMNDLTEDKHFVMNTYYSLTRRQLDQFMQKLFRAPIRNLLDQASEDSSASEEEKVFITDMFTYALVGIITEWIAEGMPQKGAEDLNRLFQMMEGCMAFVVKRMEGDSSVPRR
ncbi:MAG: TetR/AcrR family transcriptional regulator C-terminal domain-containing protein [Eubacteriales bacterium]|nr:TetR/AcrR family transcriptional regulator C-terminal domain-containing protein [Eubacteriales bacterium]